MTRRPTRRPRRAFAVALALAASVLCGAGASCGPAKGPGRPLPSYAGHAIELFDDVVEPLAVGITLDTRRDPKADRLLRERAQTGDATLRVRITTISPKEEDSGTRYFLMLHSLDPLAGSFPPGDTFEVSVGPNDLSNGIVKRLQTQLIGRTFIGFVRAFVRPDGDEELHFHLSPDSSQVLTAIHDALTAESRKSIDLEPTPDAGTPVRRPRAPAPSATRPR